MKHIFLCLALIIAQSAHAAEFGHLFSSPGQRIELDRLRAASKPPGDTDAGIEENAPILAEEPEPLDAVSVQGYVKRNDGKKGTVWINNTPLQEGARDKNMQIEQLPANGNRIGIKLPANKKRLLLKAGQVYDAENNRVVEENVHKKAQSLKDEAEADDAEISAKLP